MQDYLMELIKNSDFYKEHEKAKKELEERDRNVFERLKHRPSVKKLIEIGGLCGDSGITMLNIEKIDALLNDGWTYSEGCTRDITCELAFLLHLEEKFNTDITSAKQFQELAQFNPEYMAEITMFYHAASEQLYRIALSKILHEGEKYKALLELDHQKFHLPEKWVTDPDRNEITTKQDIIHQVLYFYIDDIFLSRIEDVTLWVTVRSYT